MLESLLIVVVALVGFGAFYVAGIIVFFRVREWYFGLSEEPRFPPRNPRPVMSREDRPPASPSPPPKRY